MVVVFRKYGMCNLFSPIGRVAQISSFPYWSASRILHTFFQLIAALLLILIFYLIVDRTQQLEILINKFLQFLQDILWNSARYVGYLLCQRSVMLSYLLLHYLAAWKQLLLNHLLVSIKRTNSFTGSLLFPFFFYLRISNSTFDAFPCIKSSYKFICSFYSISVSHRYILEFHG